MAAAAAAAAAAAGGSGGSSHSAAFKRKHRAGSASAINRDADIATAIPEIITLRPEAGLPPFFPGDFWATEMERMLRDMHKKLGGACARAPPAVAASGGAQPPSGPAPKRVRLDENAAAAAAAAAATAAPAASAPPTSRSAQQSGIRAIVSSVSSFLGLGGGGQSETSANSSGANVASASGDGATASMSGGASGHSGAGYTNASRNTAAVAAAAAAAVFGSTSVAEYVAAHRPVAVGSTVRVGDVALPTHPPSVLGARLRDMHREIFVVHLAPLRSSSRGRGKCAANAASEAKAGAAVTGLAASAVAPREGKLRSLSSPTASPTLTAAAHSGAASHHSAAPHVSFKLNASAASAREPRGGGARVALQPVTAAAASGSECGTGSAYGADTGTDAETPGGGGAAASSSAAGVARATEDADAAEDERSLTCDFFDTRPGFLRMCQGNHYQFDTLRRAKHSSMMILWHLQHPSIPAYAHICNVCETDIGAGVRWTCSHPECQDFDCCDACVQSPSVPPHPHPLSANLDHVKLMLR
jgi:hypothetical protein